MEIWIKIRYNYIKTIGANYEFRRYQKLLFKKRRG